MIHQIGNSRNNKKVYANTVLSPIAPQIARQPHLLALLKEAIQALSLTDSVMRFEHDMGRQIGYDEILETREKDTIFYAKKIRSDTFTRFVKHRKTEGTQYLSGELRLDDEGDYEIFDMWLGKLFPPTPDAEDAPAESKDYWENHAVVYNGQQIQTATQTSDCPY